MPNWATATVDFRGPEDALVRLVRSCRTDQEEFCFSAFRPMPAGLLNRSHGLAVAALRSPQSPISEIMDRACRGDWTSAFAASGVAAAIKSGAILSGDDYLATLSAQDLEEAKVALRLDDLHGEHYFYPWAIRNWGCKWDISEASLTKPFPNLVSVSFSTANSPP